MGSLSFRMGPPLSFSENVEGLSADRHRLQLRCFYLRETPLWPFDPPPLGPPLVAIGSQSPAHTDPHSSSRVIYIEP